MKFLIGIVAAFVTLALLAVGGYVAWQVLEWLYERYPWVVIAFVVHGVVLGTVAYLILLERKVASWVQDRVGPNRVGPWGLLQPLADGLKFFVKEDYRPAGVDRILFTVAPAIFIAVVIISVAVVPWGGIHQRTLTYDVTKASDPVAEARERVPLGSEVVSVSNPVTREEDGEARTVVAVTQRYPVQIAKLDIGVLFVVAVLSLAVYGIVVGGWASNNKYSFLGGLRATAQMISYEIPLGLSLLTVVVMFGTLELGEIVEKQAHYWVGFIPAWNVFTQPLAFVIFLICIHAEANRAPFDLAEAEQELVGGYHTEYSSMRFALFFLAEYAGMITTSAICVALFFGGWHFPGLNGDVVPTNPALTDSFAVILLRCLAFFVKTLLVIFVFMWVRWSLPRFRFDQLMFLAWRALIPLSLALLITTALVIYFMAPDSESYRELRRIDGKMAVVLILVNVLVLGAMLVISRLLPTPLDTNRRIRVPGSRFSRTPLPAGAVS
jgi:NADH-quinone oxidoreductase subunit H